MSHPGIIKRKVFVQNKQLKNQFRNLYRNPSLTEFSNPDNSFIPQQSESQGVQNLHSVEQSLIPESSVHSGSPGPSGDNIDSNCSDEDEEHSLNNQYPYNEDYPYSNEHHYSNDISKDLAEWAARSQLSHHQANDLLHLLKPRLPELPTDMRNLLSNTQDSALPCPGCKVYFENRISLLIESQNEMARELKEFRREFLREVRKIKEPQQEITDIGNEFSFPINDDGRLAELEQYLEGNLEGQARLKLFFKRCGGQNASDYARRCFRASVTDNVMQLYCSKGRSPTGKKDFSKLHIYNCMRGTQIVQFHPRFDK